MDYIKEMKWCSWYGSAGNALPEEHVKALIKELKAAKKEVRRMKGEARKPTGLPV